MATGRNTLCDCLSEMNRLSRKLINFEDILKECHAESDREFAVAILDRLELSPEFLDGMTIDDLAKHTGSPVLIPLANGNWVCFSGIFRKDARDVAVLLDPTANAKSHIIEVSLEQFCKAWKSSGIFLRGFANVGFTADGKFTAIYSLCALSKNLGVSMDAGKIIHDFALDGDEPSLQVLKKIAAAYGLTLDKTKSNWSSLPGIGKILPAMIRKRDGRFAVLCGIKPTEADEYSAVVWDPAVPKNNVDNLISCNAEQYDAEFQNELILIKKDFSILNENQPFSLSWFIPEFMRQKVFFLQVIIIVVALSCIALVIPLFFQLVVDKVLTNESYNTLNVLGIGVIFALLFNAIFEYLRDYLVLFATNKIDVRTANRAFGHLMKLPIFFFEQMPAGVLIKHMQQLDKIRSFLSGSLFFSILELLMLGVFVPFMWIYSAKLTMVVLLYSFVIASIIFVLIKPFAKRLNWLYQAEGKRQSMLVESINGIRTVKALALEPAQHKKWNSVTAHAINKYFDVSKISLTARSASRFLEQLMAVNIIWLGALDVFDYKMTIGALIAFQMLSGRVTGPIVKLIGLLHEYQQTALSVTMLGQVLNHPPEEDAGKLMPNLDGGITFDRVSFKYHPDRAPVINDFTLNIPPESMVGIVGKSGSGKTTLTKLLQGLYSIPSGIIKLSGIDLKEIDKTFLRSQIGVVLQDNFFFSGSIKENLLVTKPSASMEEILFVSRLAGVEEFVQKLPKGFDTPLEENAVNLSGGQRQRLAIARALLSDPKILIFDEATSALDPESEEIIRTNLKQISRSRTVIIVSHRLSMVTPADAIIVLDEGKIADIGMHGELLQRGGIYRDFWTKQQGVAQ